MEEEEIKSKKMEKTEEDGGKGKKILLLTLLILLPPLLLRLPSSISPRLPILIFLLLFLLLGTPVPFHLVVFMELITLIFKAFSSNLWTTCGIVDVENCYF